MLAGGCSHQGRASEKVTARYHYTPTGITKKRVKTPNASEDVEEWKLSHVAGGESRVAQVLWKDVWSFNL